MLVYLDFKYSLDSLIEILVTTFVETETKIGNNFEVEVCPDGEYENGIIFVGSRI